MSRIVWAEDRARGDCEAFTARLAELLADEEILRRVGAFFAARETGQVVLHVVRGEVAGVDCTAVYRRRWRA